MQCDPGLRQQPDQPDPGMLSADEVIQKFARRTLPVQVVGHAVLEVTAVRLITITIIITKATSNHQQ
ncbi:MAG: hypothetical protein GY696_34565 [Gammaproteobacteria bacterium]|nr:hypothetical protein [Gammaproteobacteria bacterium]